MPGVEVQLMLEDELERGDGDGDGFWVGESLEDDRG